MREHSEQVLGVEHRRRWTRAPRIVHVLPRATARRLVVRLKSPRRPYVAALRVRAGDQHLATHQHHRVDVVAVAVRTLRESLAVEEVLAAEADEVVHPKLVEVRRAERLAHATENARNTAAEADVVTALHFTYAPSTRT